MIIRALDSTHDWTFGHGKQDYKTAQSAIAEDVQTKLLSFLNDCFFDLEMGVDWINLMRQKNKQKQIALSCRAVMLKAEGVVRVNEVSVSYSEASRGLVISYSIDTAYTRNLNQSIEVLNA